MRRDEKKFILENIKYQDSDFNIKYYTEITDKVIREFFIDSQDFIIRPNSVNRSTPKQKNFHVMLLIKHFTDFKIDTSSIKSLTEQQKSMFETGLCTKIIEKFNKNLINEINQYFTTIYYSKYSGFPKYLAIRDSDKVKIISEFNSNIKVKVREKQKISNFTPTVDQLLDELNDYNILYTEWKDSEYLDRVKHIEKVLKGEEPYYEI